MTRPVPAPTNVSATSTTRVVSTPVTGSEPLPSTVAFGDVVIGVPVKIDVGVVGWLGFSTTC